MIDVEKLLTEVLQEVFHTPRDRPSRLRIALTPEEHAALRDYIHAQDMPFYNMLNGLFIIVEPHPPQLDCEMPPTPCQEPRGR